MSEVERLGLVLGLAAVVVMVTAIARRKPLLRARTLDPGELEAGVYLLTSEGCESCDEARSRLESLGVNYQEAVWQSRPELFSDLGIDAVPSLITVDDHGIGRWWRGGVPRRFEMPRRGATGG